MTADLALPLVAVFISVALAVGSLASMALGADVARASAPAADRRHGPVAAGHRRPGSSISSRPFLRPAQSKTRQLSKTPQGDVRESVAPAAPDGNGGLDRSRGRRLLRARRDGRADHLSDSLPLALMGTEGWLLAIVAAVLGYLVPDLAPDARDAAAPEGDPERPAGRDRPDRRLRRGRLEPRPGDHARERRARTSPCRRWRGSCGR